ncbi:hypothetical protein [uncultured Cloacibacillus sp.]|uniref:hypothetical protein n=1 Tax=uncultured Cloacibacillus sp. TaxID=889794 RepID=UPI0026DC3452|nr:hypothetical protein [uncultured Cloacibacillus sp.]
MVAFGRRRPDKANKKAFTLPHLYVILFCTMLFVTALTYVVPSGEFDRVKDAASGRTLVVPGSYKQVESSPVGLFQFGLIIPKGISETISIITMVLFCCGSISVISGTGAVDAGIASIIKRSRSKEHYVLLILFTLFSFLGAAGYAEDVLPFIPLAASVILALGYDKLVAASVVFCGVASGFTPGFCNLMTVGVSHAILGLPIFSGMSFRLFAMACFYITGLIFVLRYAHKIKKDPNASLLKSDDDIQHKDRVFRECEQNSVS